MLFLGIDNPTMPFLTDSILDVVWTLVKMVIINLRLREFSILMLT